MCRQPPIDPLEVPNILVCRPCAAAIGRVLETTTDSVVANLWRRTARLLTDTRRRAAVTPFDDAPVMSFDDAQAHCDLGSAYRELGLGVDAIREFAIALRPSVPKQLAAKAFFRIFLTDDARPEALWDLILAFRKDLR